MRKIFVFIALLSLVSCWENVDDIAGSGQAEPVSLTIVVTDNVSGAPVSAAAVEVYVTLADYVTDQNMFLTGTTDANGKLTFDATQLGTNPTRFYFTVKAGAKRNWAFVSATPVMTLTSGATEILTKVDNVLPQFLALAGNRYKLTSYLYGGSNIIDPASGYGLPACRTDDQFVFLKTGRLIAYDAGTACSPSHVKGYTVAGLDWCPWVLKSNGAVINMKDLDPDWYSSNPTAGANRLYDAGLTIAANGSTVTIDYGGGYIATLTKL